MIKKKREKKILKFKIRWIYWGFFLGFGIGFSEEGFWSLSFIGFIVNFLICLFLAGKKVGKCSF